MRNSNVDYRSRPPVTVTVIPSLSIFNFTTSCEATSRLAVYVHGIDSVQARKCVYVPADYRRQVKAYVRDAQSLPMIVKLTTGTDPTGVERPDGMIGCCVARYISRTGYLDAKTFKKPVSRPSGASAEAENMTGVEAPSAP